MPVEIELPDFSMVRPTRPILEQVSIHPGKVVPEGILINYNSITMYALALEGYAWGGVAFGGLEKYIQDINYIINQ